MSNQRASIVLALHQNLHPTFTKTSFLDSEFDSAFAKMLSHTVFRHYVSINAILTQFITRKIPNKYQLAQTALICAITELLLMNSATYAVINSYVDIIKKHCSPHIGGFANAVLRKINQNIDSLKNAYTPIFFTDSFKKILSSDYTYNIIKSIEDYAIKEPLLNITVKNNPKIWADKLNGTIISHNNIALPSSGRIEDILGYKDGQWWVQDISASLAAECFSSLANKRVLDLCAAPGGKTAQLINSGANVTSLDCSQERLNILQQNLQRLHLTPQQIICADAIQYLKNFNDTPFDCILLDAPCSATGVFRRHPELVHKKKQQDIVKQASIQKKLLDNISKALKIGGELIYCTCSISKIEGEQQILNFITTHPEFKIIPLTNHSEPQSITSEGFIRTLPFHYQPFGCDAFFIAKLIKEK